MACSLGLKAELLELVYRLHLSMAYQTRPEYHQAILLINTQRILDLAPNNVFNARAVCINPFIGLSTKYDVSTPPSPVSQFWSHPCICLHDT